MSSVSISLNHETQLLVEGGERPIVYVDINGLQDKHFTPLFNAVRKHEEILSSPYSSREMDELPYMILLFWWKLGGIHGNSAFTRTDTGLAETIKYLALNDMNKFIEAFDRNNIMRSRPLQHIIENPYSVEYRDVLVIRFRSLDKEYDFENLKHGITNMYISPSYLNKYRNTTHFINSRHWPMLSRSWPIKMPYMLYIYIISLIDYNVEPDTTLLSLITEKYNRLAEFLKKGDPRKTRRIHLIEERIREHVCKIRWRRRKSVIMMRRQSRAMKGLGN
jgi:hypothetical protein